MTEDMENIKNLDSLDRVLKEHGLNVMPETLGRYSQVLMDINTQKESLRDIKRGIFEEKGSGLIVEKDIPIFSWCEHHILPWFGSAHVGYISHGKVLGLSKFTRIVRYYSVGLTIQERVTTSIADFIVRNVSPDCIVVIQALHTCKVNRGVVNPFSRTTVADARGLFREEYGPRFEFYESINNK